MIGEPTRVDLSKLPRCAKRQNILLKVALNLTLAAKASLLQKPTASVPVQIASRTTH